MAETRTIAEWMDERGMGLAQLVEACALDRKLVEAIVAGRYTPSPEQRQRLAAALGVTVHQVAWGYRIGVDHMYGHGPQFGRSP